ncbi:hypothetical protein GCM10023107_07780 [Actinoplanes octamycinicus]|nr:hypothetical protein Aoc01nite_09310 [Actinoplanes octamycinicus]
MSGWEAAVAGAEAALAAVVGVPAASVLSSSEQAARLSTAAVNRTAEVTRVRITAGTVSDAKSEINSPFPLLPLFTRLISDPILPSL